METKEREFTKVYLKDYDTNGNLIYQVSLLPDNIDESLIGFGFDFNMKFNDENKANKYADYIENILQESFKEKHKEEKLKLEKYDTAILMATKNNKIKLKYEYDDSFVFENSNQILNNYKELAKVYADSRLIPLESVKIEYLIKVMLEIFEVVYSNNFKELILEIMKPNLFDKLTLNEKIFIELYGYLQALTMLDKNGNEIFDLDYSLLLNKEF